jgi:hypothetical protein
MARQTVTFVLDTVRDRDILFWLDRQENKSAAIREAIRTHLGRSGVTLVDVYEAIQDLKRCGWLSRPEARTLAMPGSDEPPDVVATLDRLGL